MVSLREQAHQLVITAPSDIVAWLRSLLVSTDTVFYRRGGLLVHEEKKRKFITKTETGGTCLVGFLEKICGFLDDESIPYRIIEKFPVFHKEPELPGIQLYDFQKKAVHAIHNHRRGVIWLPTGSGKSEVVFAALRSSMTTFRAIIAVRSVKLISADPNSWMNRGKRYGFDLGKIHLNDNIQKQITVCSIPTLISRLDSFDNFLKNQDYVFVDEGHEAPEQMEKVLARCTNAYTRICLSATPYGRTRGTNMLIEGMYGPCIFKKTQEEIHALGNAPDVEVQTHVIDPLVALAHTRSPRARVNPSRTCELLTGYYTTNSVDSIENKNNKENNKESNNSIGNTNNKKYYITYKTIYEILVYYNNEYERIIKKIVGELTENKEKGLIFVDYESHAYELSKQLQIPYAYSGGSTVWKDGKRQVRDFNKIDFEESNVWIVTPFLTTGFDYEDIHNVILCGGMKSFQRLIQRIGRGMRKRKKMILRIHDIRFELFLYKNKKRSVVYLSKHYNERIASMKKALPHATFVEHKH